MVSIYYRSFKNLRNKIWLNGFGLTEMLSILNVLIRI